MKAGAALACVLLSGGLAYWLLARPPADTPAALKRRWAGLGVEKPNVVLVTLDTTRADHLGCYGYADARTPNLDALAARGVLFREAATTAPLTLPAHSSIMTGTYPAYHGVRINGNAALGRSQQTLAEVLSARATRPGPSWARSCSTADGGSTRALRTTTTGSTSKKHKHLDLGAVQRPGNEVVDAALGWLDDQKKDAFFAWVHLYDAHTPYEPPEPFRPSSAGAASRVSTTARSRSPTSRSDGSCPG